MEIDLTGLPDALAALKPTVKKSKLDDLLGDHWPTIEESLKANVSKRQIHLLLVNKYKLEVSYSNFCLWCQRRLESTATTSK